MTAHQPPLLQLETVTIAYQNRDGQEIPVVRNVSLTMQRGETLGLVGESGCGKSTLGLALAGSLRPGSRVTAGSICFDGTSVQELSRHQLQQLRRHRIGIIPQNTSQVLTPTMRIGSLMNEVLTFCANISQQAARQRSIELFSQVRLPHPEAMLKRYPHEISGGQQQRVAVALALARQPELLILDEPTTGLDVTTQAHLLNLLQELGETTGTAMLSISHDLGVIARLSHRVAVMYAGELVEIAPVDVLFAQPGHPYTQGLLASVPRLTLATIPTAMPGRPPQPGVPSAGCAFAPRCPYADETCRTHSPELMDSDGRVRAEPHAKAQSTQRSAQEEDGANQVRMKGDDREPAQEEHLVRCHYWQQLAARAAEAASEHGNDYRNGHHNGNGSSAATLLHMQDIAISYASHGVLQRLRNTPEPIATVNDITLHLARGKTLALVGESGSGKTTIIRTLAGLKRPRSGRITFDGVDITMPVGNRSPEVRRTIQLIFQNPDSSLNPRQTVAQILAKPLRLYFKLDSKACHTRSLELLQHVRLDGNYLHRFPTQMSGGEKQRVAIARAFAANPAVVLCDEVVSALDVSVQAAVLEVLATLQREQHVSYLFITHDLAVVRAFADHVAVLYQGRICETGSVAQIFAPPWHPYTRTLLDAVLEPSPHGAPRLLANDVSEREPPQRGCPFQRRCPLHQGAICDEEPPPWQSDGAEHALRCHIPLSELEDSVGKEEGHL
jgi:peptide/nickel transport system ATP-binding protein